MTRAQICLTSAQAQGVASVAATATTGRKRSEVIREAVEFLEAHVDRVPVPCALLMPSLAPLCLFRPFRVPCGVAFAPKGLSRDEKDEKDIREQGTLASALKGNDCFWNSLKD